MMVRGMVILAMGIVAAATWMCDDPNNYEVDDASVSSDADADGDGDADADSDGDADADSDDGDPCGPGGECPLLTECCDGYCSTLSDPLNCGECGKVCPPATPYCENQNCADPPLCATTCTTDKLCCGEHCCAPTELCCLVYLGGPGNLLNELGCYTGHCPVGCPSCD